MIAHTECNLTLADDMCSINFCLMAPKKHFSLSNHSGCQVVNPFTQCMRPKLKKLKDFLSMVFYWGPVQFLSFESQCTINFRRLSVEQHEVLLRNFIAFVGSSLEFFSSLRSPLNTLLLLQSRRTLRCRKTEKNNHHVNDSHLGDASSLCCLWKFAKRNI